MALIIALFGLPVLAAENVSLRLSWDHQFTSAGFYAAEWRGYYAEAGLKVEIKPGFTRNRERRRVEDDILKGRSDFGVAAPSILMISGEAASLTIIAPLFQRSPVALYALQGTPLRSPADLIRLRVGHLPGGSSHAETRSMLLAEGIDPGAVNFVATKVPRLSLLLEGRLDVVESYSTSLPWQAHKQGITLKFLRPSSYGIAFYGQSLITSRRLAAENPVLVSRFRDASLKGWKYALEHPEKIAQQITVELPRVLPETNLAEYNGFLAKEVRRLMLYPVVPVGQLNADRLRGMHGKLRSLDLAQGEFDAAHFIFDPRRDQDERQKLLMQWLGLGIVGAFLIAILFFIWTRSLRRKVNAATRRRGDIARS